VKAEENLDEEKAIIVLRLSAPVKFAVLGSSRPKCQDMTSSTEMEVRPSKSTTIFTGR